MFVCDEWKFLKGGLIIFNREFVLNLVLSKNFKVYCYVVYSDEEDRKDVGKYGVNLIIVKSIFGFIDFLDYLKILLEILIDIVIGYGRKVGYLVCFIVKCINCKWIYFVYVFC